MARRSNSSVLADDADRDELVPNTDSAASAQVERRGRRARGAVWGVLVLTGLVALGNGAMVYSWINEDPAASQSQTTTPGRAAALEAMRDWVALSPMPTLQLLSWDGASSEQVDDGDTSYVLEQHRFSLATADGALFTSEVTVQMSAAGIPTVLSTPSLLPTLNAVAPTSTTAELLWPGYETAGVPTEAVTEAIGRWSAALVGGDALALQQVTGDESTDHVYLPLAGASAVQVEVVALGQIADSEDPSTVLARVELEVTWGAVGEDGPEVTTAEDDGAEDGAESTEEVESGSETPAPSADVPAETTTISYDLLVRGPAGNSPTVQSWGGPGAGPSLTPYSVAISGIQAQPVTTPSPASTPTPSEEATDGE